MIVLHGNVTSFPLQITLALLLSSIFYPISVPAHLYHVWVLPSIQGIFFFFLLDKSEVD